MVDDGNDDDDFVRLVVLLCCCFFFGYIAGGALCLLLLFFVSFTKNSFCCVLQQQQAPLRWTMIMVPSAVSSSIHLSNRWEDSHRCCIVCRSFYSWKERKCFSGSSDISISPLTPPRYQLHEMFPRMSLILNSPKNKLIVYSGNQRWCDFPHTCRNYLDVCQMSGWVAAQRRRQ